MNKIRLLTLSTLLPALHANAGEVAPGDYEQYPVGATIGRFITSTPLRTRLTPTATRPALISG